MKKVCENVWCKGIFYLNDDIKNKDIKYCPSCSNIEGSVSLYEFKYNTPRMDNKPHMITYNVKRMDK